MGRSLTLPLVIVMVSCSFDGAAPTTTPEPDEPTAARSVSEPPQRLRCPQGVVGTDGGLLVAGAELHGTETAGEAVEKWMASQGGADYLLTDDATGAWVLRADGTARAKLNLLLGDGWVVHGYQSCL